MPPPHWTAALPPQDVQRGKDVAGLEEPEGDTHQGAQVPSTGVVFVAENVVERIPFDSGFVAANVELEARQGPLSVCRSGIIAMVMFFFFLFLFSF